jgi:hypothetical protein
LVDNATPRRSTSSLNAMKRALLLFAVLVAASAGGADEKPDVAGELFRTFVDLRQSVGNGRHSDPRFFSRKWLEESIRNALATRNEPNRPGLNWVEDSLLTSFALGLSEDAIYSYRLLNEGPGTGDLEMQVTYCDWPSTTTIKFISEDGAWRVRGVHFDGTTKAKKWYRPDLVPQVVFVHFEPRERSRYFNESNLGRALGFDFKPKSPCGAKGV